MMSPSGGRTSAHFWIARLFLVFAVHWATSSACVAVLVVIPLSYTSNSSGPPQPLTEPSLGELISHTSVTLDANTTFARVRRGTNNPYFSDDLSHIGTFTGGILPTSPMTPLPTANQDPGLSGTENYSGGIGLSEGVILATGLVSDGSSSVAFLTPPNGLNVGAEGPNNGWDADRIGPLRSPLNAADVDHHAGSGSDEDYSVATGAVPNKNAAGLDFTISLNAPGFLEITLVFATDEWPAHVDAAVRRNDSVAVLVKRLPAVEGGTIPAPYSENYENLLIFRDNTSISSTGMAHIPMDLRLISLLPVIAREKLLIGNRVAPKPDLPEDLDNSPSNPVGAAWYDHEFSGFTKPLVRGTGEKLAGVRMPIGGASTSPVKYNVKIVTESTKEEVGCATFIKAHSLVFHPLIPGDFNMDGVCDGSDFGIWNANKFTDGKNYLQGDATFDGIVDGFDYNIWNAHKFTGGGFNATLDADANNDGQVTVDDKAILLSFKGLTNLATRFEGDVDLDGDVDADDETLMDAMLPP